MRTNLKQSQPTARTFEGAPSPTTSATEQLRRSVMANMLFEDQFYEDGVTSANRIRDLMMKVPLADAHTIAVEAREKMKLRHVPLLIAREALRNHKGRRVGDLIFDVIQRPDEMGELFALYRQDGKGEPAQLKIGLARAIKKFSEYQLAKWDTSSAAFSLRDVLFLTHARPKAADPKVPYTRKERKDKTEYVLIDDEKLFERIVKDELASPETWENKLSRGEDKKTTFENLLKSGKLGALALLRNLRNMIEAKVPEDLIRTGLAKMKTERVLPFRFITAAKYAPRLEDALEEAMLRCTASLEKLPGRTAIVVDHSLSMDAKVSAKSEISRYDAATALAIVARELGDRTRVFTFSNRLIEVAPRRGFALRAAMNEVRDPQGTYLGAAVRKIYEVFPECNRMIVITDEQSADRPPHPQGTGYIVNVGGYQQGIGYGPWVTINGWSEAILDYIRAYEQMD